MNQSEKSSPVSFIGPFRRTIPGWIRLAANCPLTRTGGPQAVPAGETAGFRLAGAVLSQKVGPHDEFRAPRNPCF